jgi:hypothetical protein
VNVVINLQIPKQMRETSWLAEIRLASQEGLCSMESVSTYHTMLCRHQLCLYRRSIIDRKMPDYITLQAFVYCIVSIASFRCKSVSR